MKCQAKNGPHKCDLEAHHGHKHTSKLGVGWEEVNKLDVCRVKHTILEAKDSKHTTLMTEYTTRSGRKFVAYNYQVWESEDSLGNSLC